MVWALVTALLGFAPSTAIAADAAPAGSPVFPVTKPAGLALSPDGKSLYVASQATDSIVVFNASSGQVRASIDLSTTTVAGLGSTQRQVTNPDLVLLNRSGTRLLVGATSHGTGNDYSGALLVIDTATNQVSAGIATSTFYGMALSVHGDQVYLADGECELTVVNLAGGSSLASTRIPLGTACQITDVAASPDGKYVYAASVNATSLIVLDARSTSMPKVGSIPMDPRQFYLSISSDGRKLFVSLKGGPIDIVSLAGAGGTVVGTVVGGDPKNQVDTFVNAAGTVAYRTSPIDDQLDVIDLSGQRVIRQVPTGRGPMSVVVDRQDRTAYVANVTTGSVSTILLPPGSQSGAAHSSAAASGSPSSSAAPPSVTGSASPAPSASGLDDTPASTTSPAPLVILLISLIGILIAAAVVLVVILRRRSRPTP